MQRACCLKYTLISSFHSHCITWHAPFFHFFGFCTDELFRGGWMMQSSHTLCVMEGKVKEVFQSKHVQELLKACEKEKIQHRVRWELILLELSLTLSGSSTVAAVGGSSGTSSWSEMQKKKADLSQKTSVNRQRKTCCFWYLVRGLRQRLCFFHVHLKGGPSTSILLISTCVICWKNDKVKQKSAFLFYLAGVSTLLGGCGATGRKFLLFVG